MAKLIYSAIASADDYIEDPDGSLDWGIPDEKLLSFGRQENDHPCDWQACWTLRRPNAPAYTSLPVALSRSLSA